MDAIRRSRRARRADHRGRGQAIGAELHGRRAGGSATIGCFSFFPTKNLGAFGDGGMVTTNDDALAREAACDMRVHGMRPKYVHHFVGGNFRLDALQAAILRVKLPRLDGWIAKRQAERRALPARSSRGPASKHGAACPRSFPGAATSITSSWCGRSAATRCGEHLVKLRIGAEVYYPISLHQQECFADLGYRRGAFPESERAERRGPRAADLPGAATRRAGARRRRDCGLLSVAGGSAALPLPAAAEVPPEPPRSREVNSRSLALIPATHRSVTVIDRIPTRDHRA